MRVGDDAASAAERHHRRVDHLGEFENFVACIDSATADEDHRMLACLDERRGGLDPVWIGFWRREQLEWFGRADFGALGEHVPRHFQRHRAATARQHFLERT